LINDALFTNEYFNLSKIPGKLKIKLSQEKTNKERPYFESDKKVFLDKIFPDVSFLGYFKMVGPKFIGSGNRDEDAIVKIKEKGKVISVLKGQTFNISLEKGLRCDNGRFVFYANNNSDSIWHENLDINYRIPLNITTFTKTDTIKSHLFNKSWFNSGFKFDDEYKLILSRGTAKINKSPFLSSFHQINFFVDKVVWQKGDSILYLLTTSDTENEIALFQSSNYFNQEEFKYFSGETTDQINHLSEIKFLFDK